MIEFTDHIAGEGKQGRVKLIYEDGREEFVKIQLADDSVNGGTPLNRNSLMAIQGFIGMTTEKQSDGSILQTNSNGHTLLTTKNPNGSITQTFTGEKVITKTITKQNGKIVEVI